MNAIIGDNGIITKAQEANVQNSIATLEEYLQLKYTENYEEMAKYKSKIEGLTNVCSNYFYIPFLEGIGGLRYVVDSDGHALYLIKKSGLPEEIKESLVGGDAGEGTYVDYQSLNDVYGVTSNLKVYYCSGGVNSIEGLAKENLDEDNPLREVFDEDSKMLGLLNNYDVNKDGKINAEEVKSVKFLTIDENSGVSNLADLYNLTALQELTIRGINLDTFAGLENCSQINYICLENFTANDYSKINSLENKLKYLYLINTTNDEVTKLCSNDKGIARGAFSELQYFALSGSSMYINDTGVSIDYDVKNKDLTDISALSKLNEVTKKSIKYLSLNNNSLSFITALQDFTNVYLLRIEVNDIVSLSGVDNMDNLTYLFASNNKLGSKIEDVYVGENKNEKNSSTDSLSALSNKTNLMLVFLHSNSDLVWIDYLSNCVNIRYFHLAGCPNLNVLSISKVKDIFNSCFNSYRSINENFKEYLYGSDIFVYKNLNDSNEEIINYLINLNEKDKLLVKKMDLSGSTLSNEKLNKILFGYNELICLNLNDCVNLSSFDFLNGKSKLEQIFFLNTKISGNEVKKIDDYTNCVSFQCNNAEIDLSYMQKTLNRLTAYNGQYAFTSWIGMGIQNDELIKKLENCTNLEYLMCFGLEPSQDLEIDLCNTKVNRVYLQNRGGIEHEIKWKLPSNFTGVDSAGRISAIAGDGKNSIIFSEGTKVAGLNLWQNGEVIFSEYFVKTLQSLKDSNSSIDYLRINFNKASGDWNNIFLNDILNSVNVNEFDLSSTFEVNLENFNNFWKNKLQNVKKLSMNNFVVNNLDFLVRNNDITDITINNGKIIDLSGISTLNSIVNLNLSNNSINNTYYLRDFKKLVTLDLSSNALQGQYNYEENGDKKSINNLEILAKLNKNADFGGNLENLYLSGNNLLTSNDYNYITKYTWTDWSGFNGR